MVSNNDKRSSDSATDNVAVTDRKAAGAENSVVSNDKVHGEGNYKSAREFNQAEREFVAAGKVPAAARAAAPQSEAERQDLFAAEEEGRRRAKGEDSDAATRRPGPETLGLPKRKADAKAVQAASKTEWKRK